jgi:chromosome segregation ATPase
MNLNQMSTVYKTTTGNALGFMLKSKATGRIWAAEHKTAGGRFLIVSQDGDNKEAVVAGDTDRYEFADESLNATSGRRAEINERMVTLMNREGQLETELDAVRDEIGDLEMELDTLEDCTDCECSNEEV